MRKQYEKPELTATYLEKQDIVRTSNVVEAERAWGDGWGESAASPASFGQ